jgi:hypothetical protein
MILNFFKYIFLRKAKSKDIAKILSINNFIYTEEDVKNFLLGNEKGVRYGNKVLIRKEKERESKYFLKIMLDGKMKTYQAFFRHVKVATALSCDKSYYHPVIKVIKFSFNFGVPYAIFETRDEGDGFGFMHDSKEFYESCTKNDVVSIAEAIYGFHTAGLHINKDIWKYTVNIDSDFSSLFFYIRKDLNQVITHKTKEGKIVVKKVKEILEMYSGYTNIEDKITYFFKKEWKYIQSLNQLNNNYIVHADMSIDNMYKHKDGKFELLDYEWVGKAHNPIVPIAHDYGNLHRRAWSSPQFQKMLDEVMLEIGVKYYDRQIVESGLRLGSMKFCIMINRFHLDYKNTVEKDKKTEEEYIEMSDKAISSFKEVISLTS